MIGHVSSSIVSNPCGGWQWARGDLSRNDDAKSGGSGVLPTELPDNEVRRRFLAGLVSLSLNGFGRVAQGSDETARSVDSWCLVA